MPVQPNPSSTRAFVSLSELAEDVLGLSRARLYELIQRGAMPQPIYRSTASVLTDHYCPVKKIAKATFAFVLSRF